jgi:HAD superfamily hydrolase (TIGR01549 family)
MGLMDQQNLNVLIVSGGGYQGLTLTKSLRSSNLIRIIMADSSEENINKYFVDRFYLVPPVKRKKQFIDSIVEVSEKERVKIIFPSTAIELLPLAENRGRFEEKGILVAVPDIDFLKRVMDKSQLYRFLVREGFPVLPILDITQKAIPYPVLGKPIRGWGSKDLIFLNSDKDLHHYKVSYLKQHYVWQPYLRDFEEYSIDCAINFDGTPSDFLVRKRSKVVGGFAAISENVHDDQIESLIRKLLIVIKSKGGRGIFNFQVIKKGADYFISDLNPRIGTSAIYSCKVGLNPALFLCSHIIPNLSQDQTSTRSYSKRLKMVRFLEELWIEDYDHSGCKAVVFDLDDTLINQKLWIFDKLEILHSKCRRMLPQKKEFLLKAIQIIEEGNRNKVFDVLCRDFNLNNKVKEELIKNYRKIEPQTCPFFPDVLPTLKELKKYGLKLALLTDNPLKSQKQKVRAGGLNKIFDVIVYTEELNDEKPSKRVFDKVAERLGIQPKTLIMVGDHLYRDIVGALEANYGFAYWLVRDGTFFNFEEKLCDRLLEGKYSQFKKIDNLRDLLLILRKEQRIREERIGVEIKAY